MVLAFGPPLAPMLARLVRELPGDGLCYEPKWDGFRCLVFRDGDRVELRSRHDRPLGRYFPEVRAALSHLPDCVLDGELLVSRDGRHDFAALLERVHPAAGRVARLAEATPARYVAFDLLALGATDLRGEPYHRRRAALVTLLGGVDAPTPAAPGPTVAPEPAVTLTPAVPDARVAREWLAGGLPLDWVPLRPELVCEVSYDRPDGWRFRHPARFRRWRPDRAPESCRIDQLAEAAADGG